MDLEYFRQLFDYSYWARDRILAQAAKLSSDDYVRPNGLTYGSLRGIMLHSAWAEAVWLARWRGRPRVPQFSEGEFSTLEMLVQRWRREETMMRAFLTELSDQSLMGNVSYQSSRSGKRYTDPLWQLLAHVVNHATQHRSEAAEALTMLGHSPGDLDLLDYFRDQTSR